MRSLNIINYKIEMLALSNTNIPSPSRQQSLKIQSQIDLDLIQRYSAPENDNKSECLSPKSSTYSSKGIQSETQTRTRNTIIVQQNNAKHDQQVARLSSIIALQQGRNDMLSLQLASLAKQNHIQQTLIGGLKSQKQKLVEELHYMRKSFQTVQFQRNKLLIQTGKQRNQINITKATVDVYEDQVSTLEHNNRKLIAELNFEKQMLADYRQQNAMFKAQIKNIANAFISLKSHIIEQKQKADQQSKQILNSKIESLTQKVTNLRSQIKNIELQQRDIQQHKDNLFSFVKRVQLNFQTTRTQLSIAKTLTTTQQLDLNSAYLARQAQFRKSLQTYQQKTQALSSEVAALKKRNAELHDELTSTTHVQLLAPSFHTNTGYMNKMMKENHREIMEIKQIIQMKDQQIERLKQAINLEKSSNNSKTEQIQKLLVIIKVEKDKLYGQLGTEIEQLKSEKARLMRKVQQIGQNVVSLKAEIMEKDRIILNYVNKCKQNKGK